MQTAECPESREWERVWFGETWQRWTEEKKSEDTATTLMSRRFMSCWSAERKPWLILGKTIWAGVWGQEVVGQRWEKVEGGWRSQKKKEDGGGRQRQKETDSVRKAYVHEPRSSAFTDTERGRNPHFSSSEVVLTSEVCCFFCFFSWS